MSQLEISTAYQEAVNFKNTQQYWKAINRLKELISYESHKSVYYADLGFCLMKLGCHQEALNNCSRAVELDIKQIRNYENMAVEVNSLETGIFFLSSWKNVNNLNRINEYEKEIKKCCNDRNYIKSLYYLDKCLEEFPKCVRYKFMKAEILVYLEEYEKSSIILEKIEDNSIKSIYINGLLYLYDKCDLQEAINCFERVLSKTLSCDEIYKKTQQYYDITKSLKFCKEEGNSCFRDGQYSEARDFYTKGLQIDPHLKKINATLYFNRALTFYNKPQNMYKYEELDDLTKCIQLDPMYQKAYFKRAEIYLNLNNFQNAIKNFEIGLTLNGNLNENLLEKINLNYFEAYLMRIKYYIDLDNFEYAIKDCETVYKMDVSDKNRCNPYYMKAILKRAQYFMEIKNFEQAVNDFKKAFQMDGDQNCLEQYVNNFSETLLQYIENLTENYFFTRAIRQYEEIFYGNFQYKLISAVKKNCETAYIKALMNRAEDFIKLKKYNIGIREYELILSFDNISDKQTIQYRYLDALFIKAQQYFDYGDFELCIKEFEKAFALNLNDSEILFLQNYKHIYLKALLIQAREHFELENFQLCTKIYEKALNLSCTKKEQNILINFQSNYIKMLLQQAENDTKHANFTNAINIYKKILTINNNTNDFEQNYIDVLLKRANFYLTLKKYEEAVKDFDEIYTKCKNVDLPDNFQHSYFEALLKLSQVYTDSGNLQESLDCYLKITQLENIDKGLLIKYTEEILKIAELFIDDGKYEMAEQIYEKLCQIDNCERNQNLLETVKHIPIVLNTKNYYEVLNVEKNASDEDIKKAYRKQSKLNHPDKHNKSSTTRITLQNEIFKIIMKAYTVLSDPIKRAQHDREI